MSHFCEEDPIAKIQSVMLTFQGGSDGNCPDFLFRVNVQHLSLFNAIFDEMGKTSGFSMQYEVKQDIE